MQCSREFSASRWQSQEFTSHLSWILFATSSNRAYNLDMIGFCVLLLKKSTLTAMGPDKRKPSETTTNRWFRG